MAATLAHRGPDDDGTWCDAATGLALGFRRLAVIDPTPAGNQPMVSADGRWVLVYNGEVYNFRDLRLRLDGTVDWRSSTDTEVLLEAIARWGPIRAVQEADGMFALAAWDRDRERLTLVRDRLGIKPLYYGRFGSHLLFGSELQALRAHPAFEHDLDRDALVAYLRHNYVPAPHCIHAGVRKLEPGTAITFDCRDATATTPTPETYWSLHEVAVAGTADPLDVDLEEAADAVEERLAEAVRRRLVADVPLGAFLSGGIDSSTVVALMQQAGGRPARTYTIGFEDPAYDEAPHARAVAGHLGADHTEQYLTADEARAVIPRLPAVYGEPFADSSQIPTLLVSEVARREVTVALSGDGGDELFGGYTRYAVHRQLQRHVGRVPDPLRRATVRGLRAVGTGTWNRLAARAAPILPSRFRVSRTGEKLHKLAGVLAGGGADATYRQLVSHWHDPAGLVIGGQDPATRFEDPAETDGLADPAARAMYLDAVTYLPDDLLTKVDRASMAVGLEVRVPMLDHRLVELAWRLPLEHKLDGAVGKRVLRRVLHRHVPQQLVDRPKTGFGVPIGAWLCGSLREWAEDLLAARSLTDDGILAPAPIRAAWEEHLEGRADHTERLWGVLSFQAWRQDVRSESVRASR